MAGAAKVSIKGRFQQGQSSGLGSASVSNSIDAVMDLALGVAADQFDLAYSEDITIPDGADNDIDLSGSLTDAFGQTIAMAKMVALIIIADAANTTDISVGDGTNPFLGFLQGTTPVIGPLKAGAFVALGAPGVDGLGTITDATDDILRISNSAGASAKVKVMILGRSS